MTASNAGANPSSAWLTGLMLGGLTGITSISWVLGLLAMPILVVSLLLIAWKGPRAIAGAGFLTGIGLLWTAAIVNSTLSCLLANLNPGRSCEHGHIGPWLAAGMAMLLAGLALSAQAFKRLRPRS